MADDIHNIPPEVIAEMRQRMNTYYKVQHDAYSWYHANCGNLPEDEREMLEGFVEASAEGFDKVDEMFNEIVAQLKEGKLQDFQALIQKFS
jgi:arginine utilization protein RocB